MAITVNIEGGGTVDFPDGTAPEAIKAAMDKNFGGGVPTAVVTADGPGRSVAEEMDAAKGSWTPEMLRNALPDRKTITDFIRPTAEMGGMVVGGLAGAPFAPETLGMSVPAGAAGGYAIGKKIMDVLEGKAAPAVTGNKWLDPFIDSGKDLLTGAEMEATGAGIGKTAEVLSPFIKRGYNAVAARTPGTQAMAQRKAGQILTEKTTPPSQLLADEWARNEAEALALREKYALPNAFTPGKAAKNDGQMAMETSLRTKDMTGFGAELNAREMENAKVITNKLDKTFGHDLPIPAVQEASTTGVAARDTLRAGKKASQQEVSAAYDAISGEYAHPVANFKDALKQAHTEFQTPEAEAALNRIAAMVEGKELNTKTATEVDKYLSQVMRDNMNTTPSVTTAVGRVRDGLKQDFKAMGEAAQNGDIALHEGKLVIPSQIQTEISDLTKQAEMAAAQGASLKEQNAALADFLRANGERPQMQNLGITDEQYAKTLQGQFEYLQRSGVDTSGFRPPVSGANAQVVENLQNGIAARRAVLDNLTPAEDVAAQYANAHGKALEHFDKYGKSEIKKVLNYGDTMGGGKIAQEAVPATLFTEEGAKQLVNAVGTYEASGLATPHLERLIFGPENGLVVNGALNIQGALKLIDKNAKSLETLGLTKHAEQLVKDQVPATIRKELESVREFNGDNPVLSADKAAQWAKRYAPALKRLYGSNAETIAMQDFSRVMRIMSRKATGSGSDTIMKAFGDAPKDSLTGKMVDALGLALAGGGMGYAFHGGMGGVGGAIVGNLAGTGFRVAREHTRQIGLEIIKQSILNPNPETIKMLMQLAKGKQVSPAQIQQAVKSLSGYTSGVMRNPTQPTQSQPAQPAQPAQPQPGQP